MPSKKLNIAMIGYGFMGRAHSNAIHQVNHFFDLEYEPIKKAACARNPEKLKDFADRWGWETTETDWRKLIDRKDIDCIDIGSCSKVIRSRSQPLPVHTHEIAIVVH